MSDENLPTPTGRQPTQPSARPVDPYGRPIPSYQPSQPVQPYQPWGQVQPYGHGFASATVVRPHVGGVHLAIAWVFAVFTLGYFLPWAIAATRQKSNTLAIGLLNFLVGWTIIGWVASLVMACMSEPMQVNNVAYAVAPVIHTGAASAAAAGWYPDNTGGRRYWDGQQWTQHTAP